MSTIEQEQYATKLAAMSDKDFLKEAEQVIWLSAYANNNPRSKYHWQADACYTDAKRRHPDGRLYDQAYQAATGG